MAETVIHSKTKRLVSDVLGDFFSFGMTCCEVGLLAKGDQLAYEPMNTTANGDMSFCKGWREEVGR